MSFAESLLFYLVIGFAVAVAHSRIEATRRSANPLRHLGSCLFWPLYLPLLLTGAEAKPHHESAKIGGDALGVAIEQVEQELDAALRSLDGWTEGVLNERSIRLDELRSALTHQADRTARWSHCSHANAHARLRRNRMSRRETARSEACWLGRKT